MPHDKEGNLLSVGNVVTIPAVVKSVTPGDEYCNVTVETLEPMYPGDQHTTITLNAKQVLREEPTPEEVASAGPATTE